MESAGHAYRAQTFLALYTTQMDAKHKPCAAWLRTDLQHSAPSSNELKKFTLSGKLASRLDIYF